MSLSARSRSTTPFYVSAQMSVCIGKDGRDGVCILCVLYARVCIMCIRRAPSFSRLPPCAEVGDSEGGPKRGGAREVWGGENKLISLTQPAVTPPQHDINPKPRLSLFKLYESLRRRIRGGNSLWEALYPSLSLRHTLSISYSLVGRL